jgi:aconitate hydratase
MGILPLQFRSGDNIQSLELTGTETFDIEGLTEAVRTGFANGRKIKVKAVRADGSCVDFPALVRIDTPQEVLYYRHGGILQYVLRQLLLGKEKAEAISPSMAGAPQASPEHTPGHSDVEEAAIESFPASDPPAY